MDWLVFPFKKPDEPEACVVDFCGADACGVNGCVINF